MPRTKKLVLISDITHFADSLARSLRRNLQWSAKLRKSVKLHPAQENGETTSAQITIGEGDPNLAGMARAFAFGSGLHATRGTRRKYVIAPRNKKALWFPYPSPKVFPGTRTYIKDGQFGITVIPPKVVHHPGVESKNYIQKSIDATLAKSTDELKVAIRRNLVDELRLSIKEVIN